MKKASGRKFIITVVLAAVILLAAVFAWAAVRARALQCYVIEGAYPESLEYLVENYGLAVNTDDYRIVYIPYAENLPPEIKVIYLKDK